MSLQFSLTWTLLETPPRKVELSLLEGRVFDSPGELLGALPPRGTRLVVEGRLWEVREKALSQQVCEQAETLYEVEIDLSPVESWDTPPPAGV